MTIALAGAHAGYAIARWRGLSVGLLVATGAMLAVPTILVGTLWPMPKDHMPKPGAFTDAMSAIVLWFVAALAATAILGGG